jgi:hypothetical protein
MARKTTETPANPPATFSPEALAALLNEVSASRKAMQEMQQQMVELRANVVRQARHDGRSWQDHATGQE